MRKGWLVGLMAWVAVAVHPAWAEHCQQNYTHWSDTQPSVNLGHVITGEINKRGRAVGFHSRSGGKDPQGARLIRITAPANRYGIYRGQVALCHGQGWTDKRANSTFFPDSWSHQQVVEAILRAHGASSQPEYGKWSGVVDGITIEGYMCNQGQSHCPKGNINTAYPIYQ
ncbi:EndoU domain-containing protein [Ferrimonas sp. SCSIO 43195]|uniref:EndoU domain-containing protein n=1 Tax=Ferrimonas sp. SCSIO 43195 TaxID=2822844 RepID=UPI002074DDC0|nr:EndoU domain-containing protein [Ferrimonas sp. SCSIO 43195]USD35769.1 EndoU domain-containing protein [Ferrimonas sp. SCSIO 43195]